MIPRLIISFFLLLSLQGFGQNTEEIDSVFCARGKCEHFSKKRLMKIVEKDEKGIIEMKTDYYYFSEDTIEVNAFYSQNGSTTWNTSFKKKIRIITEYDINGKLILSGQEYGSNVPCRTYDEFVTSAPNEKIKYDYCQDGVWQEWYSSGLKKSIEFYESGNRVGKWQYWDKDGKLKREIFYDKDGNFIKEEINK